MSFAQASDKLRPSVRPGDPQHQSSELRSLVKPRAPRAILVGVVTGDKMNKTRRVEIQRLVKHARYGKYIKRRTVCYVHDERNESHVGDTVEIMETRRISKTKCWRLVRIISRGAAVAPARQNND